MTPPVSAPALAGLCWNIHDSPVTVIYSVSLSGEMYVVRRSHAQWAREGQTEKKKQRRIRARKRRGKRKDERKVKSSSDTASTHFHIAPTLLSLKLPQYWCPWHTTSLCMCTCMRVCEGTLLTWWKMLQNFKKLERTRNVQEHLSQMTFILWQVF